MTPETVELIQKLLTGPALASAAAALLSLAATYFPKLNTWFAEKDSQYKQLAMLITITVICLVLGVLSWTGVAAIIPPGAEGGIVLFMAWLGALQTNQAAYKLSPEPSVVTRIKAAR